MDSSCSSKRALMVDLTLASTYVPGVMCLMRASIVIIVMSRYSSQGSQNCLLKCCIL